MNKVLLSVNKSQIDKDTQKVNDAINIFNPLYERFKLLNVGDLKTEDLKIFLLSPKEFFLSLFTKGESMKIGDLTLSNEKVYELLDRPDGLDALVNDIENQQQDYFSNQYFREIENIEISENKIVVKKDYLESLKEKHSIYAVTHEQIKALEILTRVGDDLQTLINMQKKPFYSSEGSWFDSILTKTLDNKILLKRDSVRYF